MKEGYVAPPALWSGKLVDEIFSQPPKAKENLQLLKQKSNEVYACPMGNGLGNLS